MTRVDWYSLPCITEDHERCEGVSCACPCHRDELETRPDEE